jgi:hypothetical protein
MAASSPPAAPDEERGPQSATADALPPSARHDGAAEALHSLEERVARLERELAELRGQRTPA